MAYIFASTLSVGKLGNAIEFRFSADFSPRNLLRMPFPVGTEGVVGCGLLTGTGGMGLGGVAETSFLIVLFLSAFPGVFLEGLRPKIFILFFLGGSGIAVKRKKDGKTTEIKARVNI